MAQCCKTILSNMQEEAANFEGVQVIIRLRPLAYDPTDPQLKSCVTVSPTEENTVVVQTPNKRQYFSFDHVADQDARQSDVFEMVGKPVLEESFRGYNCCIFAYGQTGAGKTFSILGNSSDLTENGSAESRGILPRLLQSLFFRLRGSNWRYKVNCSYLEIYNQQIIDLLNKDIRAYPLRQDFKRGVYVQGLQEEQLNSYEQALGLITKGLKNRKVASTAMNSESSRSHSIFTINLKLTCEQNGNQLQRFSKIHVVDLAGSQRVKQTNVTGDRFKEGCNINRSLHCLGNVINSLVQSIKKKKYVPYRDSKLTFFLKDSLGGNSKTKLLANINPNKQYLGDTISTLMFAKRAKILKIRVQANENIAQNFQSLRAEIRKLRQQLSQAKYIKKQEVFKVEDQSIRYQRGVQRMGLGQDSFDKSLPSTGDKNFELDVLDPRGQSTLDLFAQNQTSYRQLLMVYQHRVNKLPHIPARPDSNFKHLFQQKRQLQKQNAAYSTLLNNVPGFTKIFKDNLQLKKTIKKLETTIVSLTKQKQDSIIQIQALKNSNAILKEQRDELEAQLVSYKIEVDYVIASGIKAEDQKNRQKTEFPAVLPLLQLSRLQDQATVNMTRRQDMRQILTRQHQMLEEYQTTIEQMKAKFATYIQQLHQSYQQLQLQLQQQRTQKKELRKMRRPQQSPQVQTMQDQNQYLKLSILELQDQIRKHVQQNFKKGVELKTIQNQNMKMNRELEELRLITQGQGLEEVQLTFFINKIRQIKQAAQKDSKQFQMQLERHQLMYYQLKQKMLKVTEENSTLLGRNQALQHKCKQLRKRFGQSTTSKLTVAETLVNISDQQQSLAIQTQTNERFAQLNKQITALSIQKQDLLKQLQDQMLKNNEDRLKLERASMKILSLSKEVVRLRQQNEHYLEDSRLLQIRLQEAESGWQSLKQKIKVADIQNNRYRKQLQRRDQITLKIKTQLGKSQLQLIQDYKILKADFQRSRMDSQHRHKLGTFSSSSRSLRNLNQHKQLGNHSSVQPFTTKSRQPTSIERQKKQKQAAGTSAEKKNNWQRSLLERNPSSKLRTESYENSKFADMSKTQGPFVKPKKLVVSPPPNIPNVPKKK